MPAILRDGTVLEIGDEVTTNYHKTCIGQIFIVEAITPYRWCESKTMVLVHLKGDPARKIVGLQKEGIDNHPPGLDANWFKLLK